MFAVDLGNVVSGTRDVVLDELTAFEDGDLGHALADMHAHRVATDGPALAGGGRDAARGSPRRARPGRPKSRPGPDSGPGPANAGSGFSGVVSDRFLTGLLAVLRILVSLIALAATASTASAPSATALAGRVGAIAVDPIGRGARRRPRVTDLRFVGRRRHRCRPLLGRLGLWAGAVLSARSVASLRAVLSARSVASLRAVLSARSVASRVGSCVVDLAVGHGCRSFVVGSVEWIT